MKLQDTSAILKKLWLRPAENGDLIVDLAGDIARFAEIHCPDAGPTQVFAVVHRFPGSVCVKVEAVSTDAAREIVRGLGVQSDWAVFARSEEMALALCEEIGRTNVALSSIHYAVDKQRFQPARCDLEITPAGTEDIGWLLSWVSDNRNQRDCIEDAASQIDAGTGVVFVAREADRVVGYITATKHVQELWEVGFCYVDPEMRSKGIGRQLISVATAQMLSIGAVPLYTTYPSNDASGRACQAVGYYRCSSIWRCDP